MPWVRVAETNQVPAGAARVVEAAGRRIALCNTGSGYHAIDDICSHDGASLDQGKLEGTKIECPRHGATFDVVTGKALSLPAIRPIRSYVTRIQGNSVEVEVP